MVNILDQQPASFPWSDFLVAQGMKNQNLQEMYKNIKGIGTGFGSIGKNIEKNTAKEALFKAFAQMRGGPIQGPQLPGVGLTAGQPQPTSGMGSPQPQPDFGSMAVNYATAFPGEANPMMGAFANQFDPEKKATIAHLNAETAAIPETTKANIAYKQIEALLQAETIKNNKAIAEGRLEDARIARENAANLGLLQRQIQAQIANSQHPIRNFLGMKPLVDVPTSIGPAQGFGSNTGVSNFKVTK